MENPFNTINEKLDSLILAFNNINNQYKEPLLEDDITNVKGAAKILDSASGTIYNLVHERRIPYHKQGKKLYFFKSELLDWIKMGKQKTKGQIAEDVNQKLCEQKSKHHLRFPSKEKDKNSNLPHSENTKAALDTAESQGETIEEAIKETGQLLYLRNEENINLGEEE